MRGLWFSYGPDRPALAGVDLAVAPGQVTMLLGRSGSGKSTLLKLVKGLLRSARGDVAVLGKPVSAAGRLDPAVAYVPQQLGLVRGMSALENTLVGALGRTPTPASLLGVFARADVEQAHRTLAALGIGHKVEEKVHALSGGERQRVAIARALMQRASLLLADEIVSQLDDASAQGTLDAVHGIAAGGVSVVMAVHDLNLVHGHADRVAVLREGRLVVDRAVAEVSRAELARAIAG